PLHPRRRRRPALAPGERPALPARLAAVLQTERLLLRKPVLEDAQAALDLLTDPVAMEFIGGVHPEAAADPEFAVRRWLARWEENGCGPFMVVRRDDER